MLLIFFVPAFLGRKKIIKEKKNTLDYTVCTNRERERVLNPYPREWCRPEFTSFRLERGREREREGRERDIRERGGY